MTIRHNFWTGESWHITKNAYDQWPVKKIASNAILKKILSLNSKLLTSPNEHRVRFHRYCFWKRFPLSKVRLSRTLHVFIQTMFSKMTKGLYNSWGLDLNGSGIIVISVFQKWSYGTFLTRFLVRIFTSTLSISLCI